MAILEWVGFFGEVVGHADGDWYRLAAGISARAVGFSSRQSQW